MLAGNFFSKMREGEDCSLVVLKYYLVLYLNTGLAEKEITHTLLIMNVSGFVLEGATLFTHD